MDSISFKTDTFITKDFPRLSSQLRLLAVIVCFLIFTVGYLLSGEVDFTRLTLFAFIPIVLGGMYYGFWAGMLLSTVILVLNTAWFYIKGGSGVQEFLSTGGLSSYIALMSTGILAGYLGDLRKRLEQELSLRKRAEVAAFANEARASQAMEHFPKRFMLSRLHPINNHEGSVTGCVFVNTDATDLKISVAEHNRIKQDERDQRILAEALRDINAALNSTLNFDEVLDRILTNVGRAIKHDSATIMLVDSGIARVARCKGYAERGIEDSVIQAKFSVAETPNLRQMSETGQPIFVADTHECVSWIKHPETSWLRSYVGAPMRIKGQTIGFINLDSHKPGSFNHTHAERLQAISDQAGVAIDNARLFEEVQRFARQMTLLNDITRIAISAPNFNNMLQRLADRLGELFNADGAYITLWDENRGVAVPAAAYGPARETYPLLKVHPDEKTMTACVLKENRVLVAEDVCDSPYTSPTIAASIPTRSMMALPLIADGHKLGAALIGFNHQHHFTYEDKSLGDQAAAQISLAIFKSRVLETERKRTAQLTRANSFIMALGRVASRIEKAPDPDIVMETLGSELKKFNINSLVALKVSGIDALSIHYLSLDSKAVDLAEKLIGISTYDYRITSERFYYYHDVIDRGQAVFSPDPELTVNTAFPGIPKSMVKQFSKLIDFTSAANLIFLPLIAEERTIGTLWLWGEDLKEDDLPAASVFASQVAVALENARLYNHTQHLAITDDLTELYNRRGFFEFGQRELERAWRFEYPLSAVMIDIDHFKVVNDTHGHTVGDQILKGLSHRLKRNLRAVDVIGRYGGEEFVILLPETGPPDAQDVAERLNKQVVCEPFNTDAGNVFITISLGVSSLVASVTSLDVLIANADRALYDAKGAGRNRVSINSKTSH